MICQRNRPLKSRSLPLLAMLAVASASPSLLSGKTADQVATGEGLTPPASASASPVAILDGGTTIYLAQVDETIKARLYELEQQIYALRKSALDRLIVEAVLQEEAKSKGVSVEELSRKLMPERVDVPQAKIDQEYAENAGGFAGMTESEARMRIRLELEAARRLEQYQANVDGLRSNNRVQIALAEPEPPRVAFAPSRLTLGRADAPVTVVEFSDFECPYCRAASGLGRQLVERYGDRVRFVLKHLPLSIHPNAFRAAQASVCAAEQGRFWEYHDRLFTTAELAPPALTAHADAVGLDREHFGACVHSERSAEVVRKDMQEASRLGVRGTPSFYVNGVQFTAGHSLDDLAAVIDAELGVPSPGEPSVAQNGGQSHAGQPE